MSHPELEFFNAITGTLRIELSEPAERIGNLENLRAPAAAEIVSLRLEAEVFEEASGSFRELTSEELAGLAFRGPRITLVNDAEQPITHEAPDGRAFTVAELLAAVEETERRTRGNTEWFDGVDVHHVFFEGIHPAGKGVWMIYWGS